jgi:hypothetical protein
MEEVGGDEVVEDEAEGVLHERIDRHYVHLWRLLQRQRRGSGSRRG